jgi:hypothetical protein
MKMRSGKSTPSLLAHAMAVIALTSALMGCGSNGAATPTELVKIQVEAVKAKDVPALKKTFSKKALASMDKMGQSVGRSGESFVAELLDPRVDPYLSKMPRVRNEKIAGDLATLEIEHGTSGPMPLAGWRTHKFVMEDGGWREDEGPVDTIITGDKVIKADE